MDTSENVYIDQCLKIQSGVAELVRIEDGCLLTEGDFDSVLAFYKIRADGAVLCTQEGSDLLKKGDTVISGKPPQRTFNMAGKIKTSVVLLDIRLFLSLHCRHLEQAAAPLLGWLTQRDRNISGESAPGREIRGLLDSLWNTGRQSGAAALAETMALLWKLVAFLQRRYPASSDNTVLRTRNSRRIAPAVRYIEEFYPTKFTLGDLAKTVCMSVPNFSIVFREAYGVPPMEYVIRVRLENAAKQLVETDNKVLTVAENCGFTSMSNFVRLFQNLYGMAPSKYRAQRTAGKNPGRRHPDWVENCRGNGGKQATNQQHIYNAGKEQDL